MSDSIRAIETRYAGCRFRSRLEARWAVFFDALHIEWEYEPEGFVRTWNDETYKWLPDFYLPATQTWIEVKGSDEQLCADWDRILNMLDWGSPVPGVPESWGTSRGVLFLGPIPRLDDSGAYGVNRDIPIHPIAQHHKGIEIHTWTFYGSLNEDGERGILKEYIRPEWPYPIGWECYDEFNGYDSSCGPGYKAFPLNDVYFAHRPMGPVDAAYVKARSARFEHGQSG